MNMKEIKCLSFNNCDFCDARCPDWVDSEYIENFLISNKEYLHKESLKNLEKENKKEYEK